MHTFPFLRIILSENPATKKKKKVSTGQVAPAVAVWVLPQTHIESQQGRQGTLGKGNINLPSVAI